MRRPVRIVVLPLLVASSGFVAVEHAVAAPTTAQEYRVALAAVPHAPHADGGSNVGGTVEMTVTGVELQITLQVSGLSPGLAHSQLLLGDFDALNACPTGSADADGNGLIDFAESTTTTGAVQKALTTLGDKHPPSAFALDRMPVADANGSYSYSVTFNVPQEIADHAAHMVLAVYGLDADHSGAYDGAPGAFGLPVEATVPVACAAIDVDGYWMTGLNGEVLAFGGAQVFGTARDLGARFPVVGLEPSPSGAGYWQVLSDGNVFAFGDAVRWGSLLGVRLNRPIVGMAATPSGGGYWLVASDGGIFAFGDAQFYGSTGSIRLNQPIVGMAPTPSGRGYWLVASDGGIFAFGDAQFYGSTGSIRLNQPVLDMAPTNGGTGYWLVARDGGIFAFGSAGFFGSTGNIRLNQPIVGMVPSSSSQGYYLGAADGGIFAFGDATFVGSAGGTPGTPLMSGMTAI